MQFTGNYDSRVIIYERKMFYKIDQLSLHGGFLFKRLDAHDAE